MSDQCNGTVGYMPCELPEGHYGPHRCFVSEAQQAGSPAAARGAVPSAPNLPEQWNCPFCGYGEYKNRADWDRRLSNHIDYCYARKAPSAALGAVETPQPPPIDQVVSEWAIEAVRYARQQVIPNYGDDEAGTPYERGLVNRIAATFRDGWLAACDRLLAVAAPPAVPQQLADEALFDEIAGRLEHYAEGRSGVPRRGLTEAITLVKQMRSEWKAALPAPHLDVQALIAKWRQASIVDFGEGTASTWTICADELEAALTASSDRTDA